MSTKYSGGFITKNPVAPTSTAASGIWTLDQQQQAQKAGTWPSPPIFIEDLFSTYLYTGNGSTQTITNGIDLSGNGGLVWLKSRSQGSTNYIGNNLLYGSAIGYERMYSNTDSAAGSGNVISVSSTGFTTEGLAASGYNGDSFVSWTFREQPKFFDVVTWTGNGTTQAISHNLGAVPGFIIIKRTSSAEDWWCFHRYDFTQRFKLNAINAAVDTNNQSYLGNNTVAVAPTSTTFTVGSIGGINSSGGTFVAYLFAHDAGGFPVSGGGSTNGISCGSYTGSGGVDTITLGYEPQWILMKATAGMPWRMFDTMRGMSYTDNVYLDPSTSDAEVSYGTSYVRPTPTGFTVQPGFYGTGATVIYIAIRRGPMKTPTVGTSVYQANTYTGNATLNTTVAGNFGFPVDLLSLSSRNATAQDFSLYGQYMIDRLQGQSVSLGTATTSSNTAGWGTYQAFDVPNSIGWGLYGSSSNSNYMNNSGGTFIARGFKRAPQFFDEVCYTGTGSATTFTHNLGVAPQLMIVKQRSAVRNWPVYTASTATNEYLILNGGDLPTTATTVWNNTAPTSSVFSVGTSSLTNASAGTYVAYLFATCAGVSKVGSYTGTGALQTINCGFTSGARFVLIKLISSGTSGSGDWYVWDSARGISSSNDPYLLLNSTSAEQTGTNFVDTTSVGFQVTAAGATDINASGDVYLFLAIA